MMKPLPKLCLLLLAPACALALPLAAQPYEPNYDEDLVPEFTLPDPLVFEDGSPVNSPEDWERRRAELLELFAVHVYGRTPEGRPEGMRFEARQRVEGLYEGAAVLEEVRIHFSESEGAPVLDLLVVKPSEIPEEGVPVFVTLNFAGNHTLDPSPEISLPESWMRARREEAEAGLVVDNRATEKARGARVSRWPARKIVESGAALASFYYGDVEPDFDGGAGMGVRSLYEPRGEGDDWAAIGAWAWGLSRALDYLETDESIDTARAAVMGHSRLGKTALWAGAQDERFALVISNNSGCGGAALSRRRFGERVARINTSFPHWFCDNFSLYNENEDELPVDQHQLVALIAPRMVYVASAVEDRWADPKGEFLAALHAEPVYRLLGREGLGVEEMPALNEPAGAWIRYHIREGRHDVTEFDWEQYLEALHSLPAGERGTAR